MREVNIKGTQAGSLVEHVDGGKLQEPRQVRMNGGSWEVVEPFGGENLNRFHEHRLREGKGAAACFNLRKDDAGAGSLCRVILSQVADDDIGVQDFHRS